MIVTVQLAEAGEGNVGNAAGADSSLLTGWDLCSGCVVLISDL